MDDDDDEIKVGREEWLEHEHTRKLLREMTEKREYALSRLLSVCQKSQDPDVVRWFQTFAETDHRIFLFTEGVSSPKETKSRNKS